MNKQKIITTQGTSGFTLVELIVVIVILAILATIAFLSFGSQSSQARDSTRLSDMSSVAKGLGVFAASSGKYPIPDDKINIMSGSDILGYQGNVGISVNNIIKSTKDGYKDPLDDSLYTYNTNNLQSKYKITGFLENESSVTYDLFNIKASAEEYINRFPYSKGDSLAVILINSGSSVVPLQGSTDDSITLDDSVDIAAATSEVTGMVALYSNEAPPTVNILEASVSYSSNEIYLGGTQAEVSQGVTDCMTLLTSPDGLNTAFIPEGEPIKTLEEWCNLTELDLGWRGLGTLPDDLWKLKALTKLNIDGNGLGTLPEGLYELTSLTNLNVSNNSLNSISENIGNLTNLIELKLSDNILSALPTNILNLTKLEELSLNSNSFSIFPNIYSIPNLRYLDFEANPTLTSVPSQIGSMVKMRKLYLGNNGITGALPEELGNLILLEDITINNNMITSLPNSFGNLINITGMDIGNNQLTKLPSSIVNLDKLTRIYLEPNVGLGNLSRLFDTGMGEIISQTDITPEGGTLTFDTNSPDAITITYTAP